MQKLIVIQGPTACGKTALAVALAKKLNSVVISADSRQFYKEIAIGTAKPSLEEQENIPHYFIDSHSIHSPVSAGMFEKEAMELIQNQLNKSPFLILVGGSGMFIDALCNGLDELPINHEIQAEIQAQFEKEGLENLLVELKEKDEKYYSKVDKNNPMRIFRAVEIIRTTGKPFSDLRSNEKKQRPFETIRFTLELPRELLYERINKRVDQMLVAGLEKEVKSVLEFNHLRTLQTVGYNEFFDYFEQKIDYETCVDKIKQHSRNYAKRQITWFNKKEDSIKISEKSTEERLESICKTLNINS